MTSNSHQHFYIILLSDWRVPSKLFSLPDRILPSRVLLSDLLLVYNCFGKFKQLIIQLVISVKIPANQCTPSLIMFLLQT